MITRRIPAACFLGLALCALLNTPAAGQSFLEQLESRLGGPAARQPEPRPSLGIRIAPLRQELLERYGITTESGVVITEVEEGSTADKYGLVPGTVIVAVNGRRVNVPDDVVSQVAEARRSDAMTLMTVQGGRLGQVTVRFDGESSPVDDDTPDGTRGVAPDEGPAGGGDSPGPARRGTALEQLESSLPGTAEPLPAPVDRLEAMQAEIDTLKAELQRLQERVRVLEEERRSGD